MQEIIIDLTKASDEQKYVIGVSALAMVKKMLASEKGRNSIEKKKENLK